MKNKLILHKKQIEVSTRVLGLLCLFFVINKQIFKSTSSIFAQEISFIAAIAGIIFLSISLNLQVKVNDENFNFFQRNTPLVFGLAAAFLLSTLFVYTNI